MVSQTSRKYTPPVFFSINKGTEGVVELFSGSSLA